MSEIGESAFEHCVQIKEVKIPNNVKRIGKRAFADCNGLNIIVIPDSVTRISEDAFDGCNNKPAWEKNKELIVYTPSGSVADDFFKRYDGITIKNDYEA